MKALRAVWASILWLFVILIPIQFYLAGHGAMEGAHAADKSIAVMKTAWDPHAAFGTLMLLISLLALLLALACRLPRRLLGLTAALFVFMIIQFFLPFLNDSASSRSIAALHGVNALIVTGLALAVAVPARSYLPMARAHAIAGEATPTELGATVR
ncbi:MAG: DUF6220 domain-containing protein [Chloroflexota bacterium]